MFALGNTEYEHFCAFGKKVERLIGQLGAERICRRGDGDDSQCIEDDFDTWMQNVFNSLDGQPGFAERWERGFVRFVVLPVDNHPWLIIFQCHRLVSIVGTQLTKDSVPAYDIMYEAANTMEKEVSAMSRVRSSGPSMGHSIKMACMTEIKELHKGSDRSCIHVELDVSMGGISYQCGDHVAILPENSMEVVEEAAGYLGRCLHYFQAVVVPNV